MRTITKEQIHQYENSSDVLSVILNTPKPDFTELDRICKEFEEAMVKAQDEDRKKIAEALK